MDIFVNCNNLDVFEQTVQTYSQSIKDNCRFYIGRQDITSDNITFNIGTEDRVIFILEKYGIRNYKIIYASSIEKAMHPDWITDTYKKLRNMSLQYLAPWYLFKYFKVEKLLCVEEDILLNIDYDTYNNLIGDYGKFSILSCQNIVNKTKSGLIKAKGLLEVQGLEYSNENVEKYILKRKLWGCPRLISNMDIDKYEEYIIKFFTNKNIFVSMTESWHHGYVDEFFHSCSPIQYKNFSSTLVNCSMLSEDRLTMDEINSLYRNHIHKLLHIVGGCKKIIITELLNLLKGGDNNA